MTKHLTWHIIIPSVHVLCSFTPILSILLVYSLFPNSSFLPPPLHLFNCCISVSIRSWMFTPHLILSVTLISSRPGLPIQRQWMKQIDWLTPQLHALSNSPILLPHFLPFLSTFLHAPKSFVREILLSFFNLVSFFWFQSQTSNHPSWSSASIHVPRWNFSPSSLNIKIPPLTSVPNPCESPHHLLSPLPRLRFPLLRTKIWFNSILYKT